MRLLPQTWISNTDTNGPASTPVGRGGMGAAVFYKGNFYIMGGEVKCVRARTNT